MFLFDLMESLRSALRSIKAHGFRSFLTTLGIIIGVAAVVATVSIIQGLQYTINEQFQGLGTNSIVVQARNTYENYLQGKIARISPEDFEMLKSRVDGIATISPIIAAAGAGGGQLRYGSQTAASQLTGSTYSYQDVAQVFMKYGRFLSDTDDATRRRVVVIGETVRENLNLPEDPVGEYIRVGDEWMKVIGLAEEKGQILGQNQDNFAVIPYSTMRSIAGNQNRLDMAIQLTLSDLDQMQAVQDRVISLLRIAHDLPTDEDDDFVVQTSEQLTDTFNNILSSVTVVMGGIVGISLLVGGIGIMNIMLVSVTERTKEIGICKAIGAKRHQILMQFLFESLLLCLLGGLVGLSLGYLIGLAASAAIPNFPQAVVPLWAVLLSFGFSAMVGLVFGIMPAAKAANLDPIEALRYE
jgi:putative ABC transport system permease protein